MGGEVLCLELLVSGVVAVEAMEDSLRESLEGGDFVGIEGPLRRTFGVELASNLFL